MKRLSRPVRVFFNSSFGRASRLRGGIAANHDMHRGIAPGLPCVGFCCTSRPLRPTIPGHVGVADSPAIYTLEKYVQRPMEPIGARATIRISRNDPYLLRRTQRYVYILCNILQEEGSFRIDNLMLSDSMNVKIQQINLQLESKGRR